MPISALLLALAAAVVHATWNLLLSGTEDTHSASAVALVVGTLVFLPVAIDQLALRLGGVCPTWPRRVRSSSSTWSCSRRRTRWPRWGSSIRSRADPRPCSCWSPARSCPAPGYRCWRRLGVLLVAAGILLVRGLRQLGAPARPRARPLGWRVHRRLHARRQARHRPRRADRLSGGGVRPDRDRVRARAYGASAADPPCAPRSAGRRCSPASASSAPTRSRWRRCGWRRPLRWRRYASRAW